MLLISQVSETTKIISATNSSLPIFIDFDDYERVTKINWYISEDGYACNRLKKYQTITYLHRFILGLKKDFYKTLIDHKDRNTLNNCKINLRFSNHQLNALNKGKIKGSFTSKYVGVYFDKVTKKYNSVTYNKGKRIWLGSYLSEIEAAQARDRYMIKYFAEHALLNFPLDTYIK